MLEDSFSDNIRQTKVIIKYEFKKYFEGKRIIIFGVLMALVLSLSIALPYIFGDGLSDDPTILAYSMIGMISLLILVSATLFASGTIVSEFEERTALVLFTKPLKKWSIYLGKVFTACVLGILFMLVYYGVVAVVSMIVTGSIATNLLLSLGLALAYVIGTTGVAVLISSVVKKSSTAAILTFISLLLLLTIISSILTVNSIEPWFMLDEASMSITNCLSNESYDALRSGSVMVIWGLVTGAIGYLAFRRREL